MSEKGRVEKEGRVIVGCWPVKERGPPGCKKSADSVQPCRVLRGSRSLEESRMGRTPPLNYTANHRCLY